MSAKDAALEGMHKLFLEALRHREQEIFHYLAILGPALGGFVWLLHAGGAGNADASNPVQAGADAATQAVANAATQAAADAGLSTGVFFVGTASVLFLLLLGAVYSLALGYNYRYITLQIAKLEGKLEIKQYMLEGWPRSRRQFLARYRLSRSIPRRIRRCVFGSLRRRSAYRCWLHKPWCTPPEIIKVFWWAFLAAMVVVTIVASRYRPSVAVWLSLVLLACLAVGWLWTPCRYGAKLHRQCCQEPKSWDPDLSSETADGGEAQ